MNTEQFLLEKWRSLPPAPQQEVIDFVEFLELKKATATRQAAEPQSKSTLGDRLQQIRE